MAWLEQSSTGRYHIGFWYGGLKFKRALCTSDSQTANARRHRVDEIIRLLESGRLEVPVDADVATFLLSDGKLNGDKPAKPKRKLRTLGQFAKAFLAAIPDGSLEETTIGGMETHLNHLRRVLGASLALPGVDLEDLQGYVDKRGKDPGLGGKKLSAATIKKELTTLRTLWNWAKDAGHVSGRLPLKGLRYPKATEKSPFQTLAEIERRIGRGTLSEQEQNELWGALFLTTTELAELLAYVRATTSHEFLHPMFVFAAHTGARRSEMLRSQLDDIDFAAGQITIREKKRIRGRLTTRSVPLSPALRQVLRQYVGAHPGGRFTFAVPPGMERSKRKSTTVTRVTRDQAHDHFKRAVSGTKWCQAGAGTSFAIRFAPTVPLLGLTRESSMLGLGTRPKKW